jgi:hypothetical protein
MNTHPIYTNSLKAIVVIFGAFSAATMVIFCTSLTGNIVGQVLTAIVGLGIVLAQYVFSVKIQQDKSNGDYDLATIVLTGVIFTASIMGTWSWAESEFNTNTKTSNLTSDRHIDNRDLIAMKKATVKEHLAQAKVYRDRGGNYNGQAAKSTNAANKVQAEIALLIEEGKNLPAETTGKSSQDLGLAMGDQRGWAWLIFALMVDLSPVLALLELKKIADTIKSDEVTLNEGGTIKSDSLLSDTPKAATKSTQYLSPPRNDERYSTIRHCVINQTVKLGKNAIQTEFSLGTKTVDKYFEWMMQEGVIKRTEGKRTYELVLS